MNEELSELRNEGQYEISLYFYCSLFYDAPRAMNGMT